MTGSIEFQSRHFVYALLYLESRLWPEKKIKNVLSKK